MSNVKTRVDIELIKDFLNKKYPNYSSLKNIKGGEFSAVYFFKSQNQNYVLRVKHSIKTYYKEEFVYIMLNKSGISIPEVIEVGHLNDKIVYCISIKSEGVTYDTLTTQEKHECLDNFIKNLKLIHQFKHNIKGYGLFDNQGVGENNSWYLGFKTDIEKFKNYNTKLIWDEKLCNKLVLRLKALIKFIPKNISYLYHGDYGNGNLLIKNNKVSAVLDWGDSSGIGDFVYDISWLDYWSKSICYKDYYVKDIDDRWNMENFEERYLFYQLYIALTTLEFYSNSDQPDSFKWTVDQIIKVKKLV